MYIIINLYFNYVKYKNIFLLVDKTNIFIYHRSMKNFNLHTYLKKICVIKNSTFADVAKKAGMSVQNLAGILNNNNATLVTMDKIADAVDCDIQIKFIDRSTNKEYEL